MKRILLGILLSLGLAALGFIGFAMLAGMYWVPKDAGLAAGATVFVYGLLGLILGFAVGAIMAWRLPENALVLAALFAVLLGLVSIGGLVWNGLQHSAARLDAPR